MNKSAAVILCFAVFSIGLAAPAPAAADRRVVDRDKKVKAIVDKIAPELISIRQDIHCHPELGLQETRTSALAAEYFRKLGLEVRTGFATTGLVAVLKGGKPGPVAAMRGDMDALPIIEETDLPYASKDKAVVDGREVGLMHACGHDIHTTVLLGVAAVLSAMKAELPGTVLFILQPGEECCNGADLMIKDGAFRDLMPQAFFAYHVDDTIKTGKVSYTSGLSSANCDGFKLVVKSAGCHGASPDSCVDPIVVGAQIVVALQVMVAREIDVNHNAVITVGSFHAGTAPNIIPPSAELRATVRNYGDDQRQLLKDKITRLVTNICGAAGAAFDLNYEFGTPSVYDDPALVKEVLPTAERVLGGKAALIEQLPEMGGEDFSYFTKLAPSVMLGLGVVPPALEETSVHSPTFLADEAAIPIGVALMADIILDHQTKHAPRK